MARQQRSSAVRDDAGEQQRRIAVEAARLISEHGIRDFHLAKRKAAERLGIAVASALPKNRQVEEALREHQRLFAADDQPRVLRELRKSASEALQFFAAFEPLLVGAVLDGSADRHSAVCLQLFSDEPEAVARFLDERGVPYAEQDRELRLTRDSRRVFPVFVFRAGDTPVDLTVLPLDLQRQPPLDRDGEKPMPRASRAALESLLADDSRT
jgi:hypothetical protein